MPSGYPPNVGLTATGRLSRRALFARAGGSALAVGAMAPLLEACGGGGGGGGQQGGGSGTLSFALFQNPDTLDPAGTSLVSTGQVLGSMFDPLVWYIPGHGAKEHYPGLAESYTVSPDGTSYTFKLRKDVTFHDGTPFDASAVKATLDHIVNPATKAKSELGSLGPYKETRVHDRYTAEVVFSQPNGSFINEMSSIYLSSPAALKKYGSQYGSHPTGTGPFVFDHFTSGQEVVVKRNPKYRWGPSVLGHSGPPTLEQITFRVLPDPGAQYNALQTGELQIAQSLTPTNVLAAVGSGRFAKFTADAAGLPYSLVLNTQRPPTDDLRVRQALQFATDREAIITTLYKGLYAAADSVLTRATLGYDRAQALYAHDPQRAGQLLDAAGWTKGSGGTRAKGGKSLELTIINAANFGFDDITQLMQSQFADLGIKATITDQAFPAVNETYIRGVMNLSDWFYADVDPSFLQVLFACGNIGDKGTGFNSARYCSTATDAKFAQAGAQTDIKKRAAAYSSIAMTLMRQAVAIPIYDLRYIYVGPKNMKGIAFTRDGTPLFHAVTL